MRASKSAMGALFAARSRGQSAVEFAFVSSLLFVFLLGIVEMGRLMFTYSAISNAAQEGARYGITRPRDIISAPAATATAAAGGAAYLPQQVVPGSDRESDPRM